MAGIEEVKVDVLWGIGYVASMVEYPLLITRRPPRGDNQRRGFDLEYIGTWTDGSQTCLGRPADWMALLPRPALDAARGCCAHQPCAAVRTCHVSSPAAIFRTGLFLGARGTSAAEKSKVDPNRVYTHSPTLLKARHVSH